jgi:hypothetical protein
MPAEHFFSEKLVYLLVARLAQGSRFPQCGDEEVFPDPFVFVQSARDQVVGGDVVSLPITEGTDARAIHYSSTQTSNPG